MIRDFVKRLQNLDSPYFRQREQDVRDVGQRMARDLAGSPPWTDQPLPLGTVIVARGLLPSEALELAKFGVVAIVSEHGGTSSHTAISLKGTLQTLETFRLIISIAGSHNTSTRTLLYQQLLQAVVLHRVADRPN